MSDYIHIVLLKDKTKINIMKKWIYWHLPPTNNMIWKTVICEENIFQLILVRRF